MNRRSCQTVGMTEPHRESSAARPTEDAVEAPAAEPAPDPGHFRHWRRWLIVGALLVAAGLLLFFVWTSFLPRWWAQTISRQTGGTFSGGVGWGLILGFLFTLVPLLIMGVALFRNWKYLGVRIALAVLAILLAVPNLITLSVSVAPGRANEIARTTMDVNAPWFRGATGIGAAIAGAVAIVLWILGYIRRSRGREVRRLRAELDAAD